MMQINEEDIIQESYEPFVRSYTSPACNNNINGFVHGGITFWLCDDMIGKYVTHIGRKGAASEANIRYYRPIPADTKLFITLLPRKEGKRLSNFLIEVKDETGKMYADAMITCVFND